MTSRWRSPPKVSPSCLSFLPPPEYWGQVTQDGKNLISSLLTVDPKKRVTATKAMQAKWMSAGDDYLMSQDLGLNLAQFKKFNATRKFKAAAMAVMSAQKLISLGKDFQVNL
jgi:calcium/calmodulin-dependent protein kinase I